MAAQAQLSRLLPLPDDELKQVLDYASTLSKSEAVEHFTDLLGDSPQAVGFISSFNSRRVDPKASLAPSSAVAPSSAGPGSAGPSSGQNSDLEGVPKHKRPAKKKKANLHALPPRQIAAFDVGPGIAYNKKDQNEDYISGRSGASTPRNNAGPTKAPPAPIVTPSEPSRPTPPPVSRTPPVQARSNPSASGTLVSELVLPKAKPSKNATKVTITGGVPMQGASTALSDLDQAIRSLEITTNPSHASNTTEGISARRCNCVATKHPILAAAPNCKNCGKVICIKEGLGPCTFCGEPLLSSSEVQGMIKELRAERGRERMAADREAHKKAEVSSTPRPFALPRAEEPNPAEARALAHRDKLLNFQAQNAQRTTIRDEAADFDVALTGSMWASPEERALALKRQQKLLREMEWNAMPEYEKTRQVVSIDISGRRVFKKMAKIERPVTPDEEPDGGAPVLRETDGNRGGVFSHNPLLGGLIKPVYVPDTDGEGKGKSRELEGRKDKSSRWRRVQDDGDNEGVILDGGISGGRDGDEPDCGWFTNSA